jgi:hypothetical protein
MVGTMNQARATGPGMTGAIVGPDIARFLSDVQPSEIVATPYAHFVRESAISSLAYEQLAEAFPTPEVIVNNRDIRSNEAVRMAAKQVLGDRRIAQAWRAFFEYHTSAEYWRDVVRLFAPHFRREFPELEAGVGRAFEDWRVLPRGCAGDADVRLDCQFVLNTPVVRRSSVKSAHIDLSDKVFSALFYMRDPRDNSAGGDLDIYHWRREPRFIKHRVLHRDVELVRTVPYRANTYMCFVNSPRAVHGVSPRGTTSVPRRYINFIAELPIKAFEPTQVTGLKRLWYRNEVDYAATEER